MRPFAFFVSNSASHVAKIVTVARKRQSFWIFSVVIALLAVQMAVQVSWGQVMSAGHPVARVQAMVDNTKRVTLPGHTLPALRTATDLGRLPVSTVMNHMVMVLQPTPEQDHALQSLLDQQLDKNHGNFHKWIKPEEFGKQFGIADSDISQVTGWLNQQGFAIESVSPSKRFIQFNGSVRMVETAFQTEMHRYNVNGVTHVANSSDISVPEALKPVIAGVPTLHDFFKKSNMADAHTITADPETGKFYYADPLRGNMPDYTNGTTHFVGAGDFAAIYNTTPLTAAGNDGTGVSIGVIGRTNLNLSDIQIYRTFFGLKANDPTFVIAGEDPGIVPDDDGESYLDVEVSGGAAPGATVKFIVARASLTADGVDIAAMYAVQNNLTDIITESYGQCENNFSAVQAAFYSNLWAQAAAQGQSVFLSAGDNGPAGCDNSNNSSAVDGYAVSMLGSTPYNVSVGGTLFSDTTGGPWWGTTATATPPFSSALGYIPEIPWNEAKGSGAVGAAGLWSGSGGISAYFLTPSWQRGFGVPVTDPAYAGTGAFSSPASPFVSGPHRYLPDVSMAAAAQHDGTLYCGEGICQLSSTNSIINAGIVGGTSVAAPTMAGVQALVDQYNGGRQGLPNYVYYGLADAQHTAGLDCASNHAGTTLDANCAFRDVTTGSTLVCADSGCTAAKKIGWTAADGYDMATGLGSPNATKLAQLWSTVTFRSTTTSMNLSQSTGITHGQPVTVTGTVAPGSGTGTPTGTITFLVSQGALSDPLNSSTGGYQNPPAIGTLDGSGNYSVALSNLPAGTYFLSARYGGDGTFASSLSSPIQVTVSAETSGITIQPNSFNGTTCIETPSTMFPYGSYIWTDFTVAGISGQGIPTGSLSITDNGTSVLTSTLNPNGVAHTLSGAIATTSCVYLYTLQDVAPPTAGIHVIGATYNGDSSFGTMTATPVTITITPATVTGALATAATNISAAGSPVQLTLTIAGLNGAGPGTLSPTGTVTFTDTTTSTVLGTASVTATSTLGGIAVLTTTAITASGGHSITALYGGDTNYNSFTSGAVTVTVQAGTSTSVAVTSNANPSTVGGRPTWTATMTPTTVTSGTVNFFDNGVLLGTGTVGAAHTATFRPAATVNLPAGVHTITASYAGNATFNSSVSPGFSQTFNQTATTVGLTVKSNGTYGDSFGMSAVLGLAGTAVPAPSGTIQFLDGGTPLGSPQPLSIVTTATGGLGIFQAQMQKGLSVGSHTITAQLTDPNYTAPVSNSQTITVAQATATVTLSNTTQTYTGSPLPVTVTTVPASVATTTTYTGSGGTTYGPTTTAPTNVGTYSVSVAVSDPNYTGSASGTLTINKATATVNITNTSQTYTGSPLPVTVTTVPSGLTTTVTYTGTGSTTYGPSSVAPANAGTYSVDVALSNPNYTGSGSGSLTIGQATATVNISNTTQTYTGSPLPVTVTTVPAGLTTTTTYTGTGSTTYGPSMTAPTNAGTYSVAVAVNDANYTGSGAGSLTINKATATIMLSNTTQTYTGSPLAVTAATNPTGLTVVGITYTGTGSTTYATSSAAPTNAGTYSVAVTLTNANYTGSASGTLTITQANATIGLLNTTQTYTGSPLAVTATTNPSGLTTVSLTYTGTGSTTYGTSTVAPTNVGTYSVAASLTNANYMGSASGTLTITQANATIGLLNTTQTYTGSPLAVTATTNPSGLSTVSITYTGTGSTTYGTSTVAPTNVGTYSVAVILTNTNYSGSASGTLTITQAAAMIGLSNTTQTYTGSPLAVTATTNPSGLTTVSLTYTGTGSTTYGPSTTAPTNVGTYSVAATLTNTNYSGSAGGTLTITQANATIGLLNTTQTYTGSPLAVTATTNPSGLTTVSLTYTGTGSTTYGPSAAAPTNAGTYSVAATLTNPNYTGSASGTLTITQANATIGLLNTTQTYTGSPLAVTATTNPSGLTTVSLTYTGTGSTTYGPSAAAPTSVGTYSVAATLTNANYTGSASGTLTINQAAASIALSNTTQTYTGSPLAVTATTNPSGLTTVSLTYTGTGSTTYGPSTTAPTSVGTYSVAATLTNANYTGSAGGTLTITQASATIMLSNTSRVYTGAPLPVTATTNPSGLTTVGITYTGTGSTTYGPSTTAPTNVGTYSVAATLTNPNYTGSASGTLTITQATATIMLSNMSQAYTGSPLAVSATTNPSGLSTVSLTYTGTGGTTYGPSTTPPINVGTYSVAATLTNANYTGSASGALTITQATATITLSNTSQIYTGSPLAVTATTNPSGLSTVSLTYTGTGSTTYGPSTTAPTNVGTYSVAATLTNANYTGSASGTLTITQAPATITLSNTSQTYTGSPLAVTATTNPSGLTTVGITYTGTGTTTYGPSATAPTNVGTYSVAATLTNATYTASQSSTLTITPAPQTINFTTPTSPVTYGSVTTQTLTATGGASGNPVVFSIGSGPGAASGTNGSTLTINGAGTIAINANQALSANYSAAAQVQKSVMVNKASATLTGPATQPVNVVSGQTGSIAVNIAGQFSGAGITAPSGSITYTIVNAASTTVASGPLAIASGAVTVPVPNTLTPGSYTINASYAGDDNYNAATSIGVGLVVGQNQPVAAITAPGATLTYGMVLGISATATFNSSTVPGTFTYTATPSGGSASAVTASTVLPAGSYTLTVNFTPTDTVTYKTATATSALTVGKTAPAVALTSSVNPTLVQNATVLTATASSTVGTPTGTVTFYDNTTSIALASNIALTAGVASATVNSLAVGTHSITAIYSGDANFSTLTSSAVSQQVLDFSMSISGSGGVTSQTILPGGTATYNFIVSPTGSAAFPAAIAFSVSGLPAGATYTITPPTIASGTGSTNVVLTVTAPAQTGLLYRNEELGKGLAPIALALLLLPLSGRMRRRAGKLGRLVSVLILLISGLGATAALTGCGTSNGIFAQQSHTYSITITGTSGQLSHSTTVQLTIE